MSTENSPVEGLDVLDDALAALALLRRQATRGELGQQELMRVAEVLRREFLGHELVRNVLGGTPSVAPGASSASAAPPSPPTPRAPVAGPTPAADPAPAVEVAPQAPASSESAPTPDDSKEPEPASPHAEAESLVRSLAAVKGQVESLGTLLPNKLGDYLVRSAKVLDGLPDDQQKGQKLAKVLFDGVGVLDQLERAKVWSRHLEAIRSKIDPVRTAVAEFLGREHNLGFVPSVGTSQVSRGSQPDGVDVRWLRAPVAPGTVLWTESRGYRSGETVQGRGAVVVADEGGSDLRARLIEAWRAIESDGGTDSRADLEKMSRWIDELVDGEDRSEANTARHAFNLIHTRNASGQHANLIKWLLAFLGKHGVYEIPVTLGKPFDSSFSPSKFERRQERSNRPVGTILRVMTPGLVDREGLALQKAVLAVSSGGE